MSGHLNLRGRPVWLGILAIASLIGYVAVGYWFPLRHSYNIFPLADVRSLAPGLGALLYGVLFVALYAAYLAVVRLMRRTGRSLSPAAILLAAAVFLLPLVLAFPINSTDVYRYFIRARIDVVHGENPYVVAPDDVPETYSIFAGEWEDATSPYGPLWELTAGLVTRLAGSDLYLALILFKGLAAASHLATAGGIWLALARSSPEKRSAATLLWAWNPALLFTSGLNGHNDLLMILWLVLGWAALQRGRPRLALGLLLLGPLTKPIATLVVPFILFEHLRALATWRARTRFLGLVVLLGAGLTWLAFLPYGSPIDLAQRLLTEASEGGSFSPLAMVVLVVQDLGARPSVDLLIRSTNMLFAVFTLGLLWLTWRGRTALRGAADVLAGYIFQAFRFRIWYAAWPFPWLLLDYGRATTPSPQVIGRLAAGLAFLLTSQLSVLIYGELRTDLMGGSHTAAHLIGVPFTLLLPGLAGVAAAAYSARSRNPHKEI